MSTQTEFPFVHFDEYSNDPRMNASTLVHGFKSMRSLKRAIDGKKPEPTPALRFGQQYHTLILEPEEFRRTHVVMPDYKNDPENVDAKGNSSRNANTKWVKAAKSKFIEDNLHKAIVEQADFERGLKMIEALSQRPRVMELLKGTQREVTLYGNINGVDCKGRLDLLAGHITDLKGTKNAEPRWFGRDACKLWYPEKLAFYQQLVKQNTGETLPVYVIAQETGGDFDTVVYPIRQPVLEVAFGRVCKLLCEYKNARDQDKWPGVDGGEAEIEFHVPNWYMPSNSEDDDLEWADE